MSNAMKAISVFDGRIGYRDFPKTACTSIKSELYHALFDQKWDIDKDERGLHKFFWQPEYYKNIENCDFKFVVVRDPVKRFLSAYSSRVVDHKELSSKELKKKPRNKHLMAYMPKTDPTLSEFIKNILIYTKVPVIDHHVQPIVRFMDGHKLEYFDKVYKIDQLAQLEKDLSSKIGVNVAFSREHTSTKKFNLGDLSYKELAFLIRFYREDYKLLKGYYSPKHIWAEWYREVNLLSKIYYTLHHLNRS